MFIFPGRGRPNARDHETGSRVSSELLCRKPAEPGPPPQTHQPVPQSWGELFISNSDTPQGGYCASSLWMSVGWGLVRMTEVLSFHIATSQTNFRAT